MDLAAWLASIYCVDTVVTDRLHVAVAAVLSGKELFYLDPYDGKITEYFSFTFRNAFQERIKRIDYDWLLDRGYVFRSGQLQRAAK